MLGASGKLKCAHCGRRIETRLYRIGADEVCEDCYYPARRMIDPTRELRNSASLVCALVCIGSLAYLIVKALG